MSVEMFYICICVLSRNNLVSLPVSVHDIEINGDQNMLIHSCPTIETLFHDCTSIFSVPTNHAVILHLYFSGSYHLYYTVA